MPCGDVESDGNRAEATQRFQDKKQHTWEWGGLRPNAREEFEKEFEHKVMNGLYPNSKADERSLQEWTGELQEKAQATERRLEARETKQMESEDSSSQRRRAEEKLSKPVVFSSSPHLRTGN